MWCQLPLWGKPATFRADFASWTEYGGKGASLEFLPFLASLFFELQDQNVCLRDVLECQEDFLALFQCAFLAPLLYSFQAHSVLVAVFSANRWDRGNRADLIESATPCHDAQVMGFYRGSNPLRPTVQASKSEDYTTASRHLQNFKNFKKHSAQA